MGEGTDITESLQLMVQQAKFNFKTMEGGQKIAQFISETIRPEIVFFTEFAINELIMNALTHGLKSVGKAATTLLFRTNITDKIKEHSSLPENIGNFVTVEFERLQEGIKIIVKDMSGKFFDVQELLSKKETKASLDIHGRGLKAIYRLCGESLDTMLSSSSNDQTASEKSAPIFKGLMSSPNTDNQGQTIGTAVEFTVLSIAPKKEMDSKPKGSSNFKP